MRFWDSSAIVPLCVGEGVSGWAARILRADQSIVVWWGTILECVSAFARRRREGVLDAEGEASAQTVLAGLATSWTEVSPSSPVRDTAERLLAVHPLRSLDALQLAAGLVWAGGNAKGHHFVCLDRNLAAAARKEGFILVIPKT